MPSCRSHPDSRCRSARPSSEVTFFAACDFTFAPPIGVNDTTRPSVTPTAFVATTRSSTSSGRQPADGHRRRAAAVHGVALGREIRQLVRGGTPLEVQRRGFCRWSTGRRAGGHCSCDVGILVFALGARLADSVVIARATLLSPVAGSVTVRGRGVDAHGSVVVGQRSRRHSRTGRVGRTVAEADRPVAGAAPRRVELLVEHVEAERLVAGDPDVRWPAATVTTTVSSPVAFPDRDVEIGGVGTGRRIGVSQGSGRTGAAGIRAVTEVDRPLRDGIPRVGGLAAVEGDLEGRGPRERPPIAGAAFVGRVELVGSSVCNGFVAAGFAGVSFASFG